MEDLEKLLLNLSELNDEEAFAEAKRVYLKLYLGGKTVRAEIAAHDECMVRFFADRFDHAFKTSRDRAREAYAKNKVDRKRLERIRWIKPVIQGLIPGVECWEVPRKVPQEARHPFPGKRLYVLWEECYVVWLEPLKDGAYKYSSAYCPGRKDIARYIERGRKLWKNR